MSEQLAACMSAGFKSVSVMVQRLHMAPVRCGFWRSSSSLSTQDSGQDSAQASAQDSDQASAQDSEGKPPDSTGQVTPQQAPRLSQQPSGVGSSLQRIGSEKRPPKHRPGSGSGSGAVPSGPLSFVPDAMLGAVEPFGAQLLELQKLSGFGGQIRYAPTRNRQCHIYVITERLNARSAPLKRVLLR